MRRVDTDDLRHDTADLGRGIELSLALAALGGKVTHQVFVGIAENIVALGAVFAEVQSRVFKYTDQVGEPVHHLLPTAQLFRRIEIGHAG